MPSGFFYVGFECRVSEKYLFHFHLYQLLWLLSLLLLFYVPLHTEIEINLNN